MANTDPCIALLLEILDQNFDGRSWVGTPLRGALRGLTPRQLLWRPAPRRHCIWEVALHAAYWKYAVRRRIERGARGAFPRRPSNWPKLPARPDAKAWKADLALLAAEHRSLRETVARLSPERLGERSPKQAWTLCDQIHGVAAHDVYHTGQIQLLKRLGAKA
jgi:hypothetical protein